MCAHAWQASRLPGLERPEEDRYLAGLGEERPTCKTVTALIGWNFDTPAFSNLTVIALRRGACDYLEKPVNLGELNLRVRRALDLRDATLRVRLQRRALLRLAAADGMIGESAVMRTLFGQIARSARTPSNVLVTGESGVGKELVARAIHGAGPRRDGPFIAVNCGAIHRRDGLGQACGGATARDQPGLALPQAQRDDRRRPVAVRPEALGRLGLDHDFDQVRALGCDGS